MSFEGFLNVAANGQYKFYLASDDGAKLYINDRKKTVINNDGIHATQEKVSKGINLPAGKTKIVVDYFDLAGQSALSLTWSRKDHFTNRPISTQVIGKKWWLKYKTHRILGPEGEKALVFRNFINNGNARSIGVSFPGKMNMIFDASNMALLHFGQAILSISLLCGTTEVFVQLHQ